MVNSPAKKEDPRITRTRNLILDAFMNSLEEKSFQSLTVQDIAASAGINRGTFYSHFSDKYALLDFSIQQNFQQELENHKFNVCTYSEENLRELVVAVCEFIANSRAHCVQPEQQFESLVETQVKKQLKELLEKWIEQAGSEFDPKSAATAASWAIYGLAMQWNHDKRKKKPSAEKFAAQILPLIAVSLAVAQAM
ncbi:MAG: TetR/AcrR family transcriptional regulator [Anaerolineales bacterium]